MAKTLVRTTFYLIFMLLFAQAAVAAILPAASDECSIAVGAAETEFSLPPNLLGTIALVESGRLDPVTGRMKPWPWSVDANGASLFFASKGEAISAVRALLSSGVRSIDVGCMQINLAYHPDAFASLEEAFDPRANAIYGARFLDALHQQTGNWLAAAAAYHSRTPEIGRDYQRKVAAIWPLASEFPDTSRATQDRTGDVSQYTPQWAAALKAARVEQSRHFAQRRPPAGGNALSSYTPAFASQIRMMRLDVGRLRAASPGLTQFASGVFLSSRKQ